MAKFSAYLLIGCTFIWGNCVVAKTGGNNLPESQLGRRDRRQAECTAAGKFSDRPPGGCSTMYYTCTNNGGNLEKRWLTCGRGNHFASTLRNCARGSCIKGAPPPQTVEIVRPKPPVTTEPPPTTTEAMTTVLHTTKFLTTISPLRPLSNTDLLFSKIKLNWDAAVDYCKRAKATLLVIEDEADNRFLNSPDILQIAPKIAEEAVWSAAKFSNTDYKKLFWEPEHDQIENFMDKSMTIKIDWNVGEPKDDSETGKDLCVEIQFYGTGKKKPVWSASDCNETKPFICIRLGEDRREPDEDEVPIEEPVIGFPGSLTFPTIKKDKKPLKVGGFVMKSNQSNFYYFYPENRKSVPSPLLNENDEPFEVTFKPTKSGMPIRDTNAIPRKTNGIVLATSEGKSLLFIKDGSAVPGVFLPFRNQTSEDAAFVSSISGCLLQVPGDPFTVEFLAFDPNELFSAPTEGKWRPGKIDNWFAKAGTGIMDPSSDGIIQWKDNEQEELLKIFNEEKNDTNGTPSK